MSDSKPTGEVFLVIGGCGFLGHNVASALLSRGESKVHILDVRPPSAGLTLEKASYHTGDITSLESITEIVGKIKPNAVFHTASPHPEVPPEVMTKVNVDGTTNIIEACKTHSVRKLIFTSSASVVFEGKDVIDVDERMPYPEVPYDLYSETKAKAETLVLEANTPDDKEGNVPKTGLRTVSIRPASIFGPNDRQALIGFFGVLASGKTNFQLGNNKNLTDWTYVDNVTHGHLLASDKLETPGYDVQLLSVQHLPRTLGQEERPERGVPTSEARPDVVGATDYARSLPSTLSKTSLEHNLNLRPVVRSRYNQFFHEVHPEISSPGSPLADAPLNSKFLPVAGEAFFITNGQPIYFWDFARSLWKAASPTWAASAGKPWVIGKETGLTLAGWAETFSWLMGRKAYFTKFKVTFSCVSRYHNIEKARRVLGYEPRVGLLEAVRRSAEWWLSTPDGQAFKAKEEGKSVAEKRS